MTIDKLRHIPLLSCLALASTLGLAQVAGAQTPQPPEVPRETADALLQVTQASNLVMQMQEDPELAREIRDARGIFVVTRYGRVAFGVGVRGGNGVLLINRDGNWHLPAFYSFGGVSAGLQAGIEGGNLAMILTTRQALDSFTQQHNWSLNADAGLTVFRWAARGEASVGKGDIIVWSDATGLLADLALSVTNISFDHRTAAAYYGREVTLQEVFAGNVLSPYEIIGHQD